MSELNDLNPTFIDTAEIEMAKINRTIVVLSRLIKE